MNWRPPWAAAASALLGCTPPPAVDTPPSVAVWARSHNRSTINVFLLCGNQDAQWLGAVPAQDAAAMEFPNNQTRCVQGLYFFLVKEDGSKGYWVGPLYPEAGARIVLVIERYAGLSSASLSRQ